MIYICAQGGNLSVLNDWNLFPDSCPYSEVIPYYNISHFSFRLPDFSSVWTVYLPIVLNNGMDLCILVAQI